jgi:hypothetical protein
MFINMYLQFATGHVFALTFQQQQQLKLRTCCAFNIFWHGIDVECY